MSTEPPPLETYILKCPHCSGAFQVRTEFRGMEVACPHCERAIEVPRASTVVPPPPPDVWPQGGPPAEQPPATQTLPLAPLREPGLAEKVGTLTAPEKPAAEELEPPRELTREERERLRRRFRLMVAVFAGIVLAIALLVLLRE